MKIMFSAGEASGDVHGASVARAIREQYPQADMLGMGGDLMKEAGVRIVYDIKNLGLIGAVEIIKSLPKFFKLRSYLKSIMIAEKPDVFVCIDYPGFNMRLAKVAKSLGIPVVYYIAPTIWAWHKSRGKDIKKTVTKVASIFPFEAEAYKEFGCDVEFVGHPLLDIVKATMTKEEAYQKFATSHEFHNVLLMPGSRKQEVLTLLDTMLGAMQAYLDRHKVEEGYKPVKIFLPRAHTIDRETLEAYIDKYKLPVTITEGNTYNLMQICDMALAASGTATLETALMGLPTVLLYQVSPITYALAKLLVNLQFIGLPNIIAKKQVIPELLQGDVNPQTVLDTLTPLLDDEEANQAMRADLKDVKTKLGQPGAVKRVAQLIANVAHQ